MKTPHVQSIPRSPLRLGFLLIALAVGCLALSSTGLPVTPARDGGYPNQNTAKNEDALFVNFNVPSSAARRSLHNFPSNPPVGFYVVSQ